MSIACSTNVSGCPRAAGVLACGWLIALAWLAVPVLATAQQVPSDTSAPADTIDAASVQDELDRRRAASDRAASDRAVSRPPERFRPDRQGTTILADWPRSLTDLLDRMGRRAPALLPKIDTLSIDYSYTTGEDIVDMRFGIQWQPGQTLLYQGDVIPRSEGPVDMRMVSFEILLDVVKGGQKVAETVIAVDSMALPSSPGYYEFDVRVPYEQVFLDVEASEAELFLEEGVDLERPLIERIGFREFQNGMPVGVTDTADPSTVPQRRTPDARPRADTRPVIYQPRTRVLIGWRIGPDPFYVSSVGQRRPAPPVREDRVVSRPTATDRDGRGATSGRPGTGGGDEPGRTGREGTEDGRTVADRGERSAGDSGGDAGEASSGRTGRSATSGDGENGEDGKRRGKKDDDEDNDNLAPAALGAAAVVAGVAYVGGTVGVYGTGETPLGLSAGVTRTRGGVHVQAAINPEVIDQEDTQRLNAKLMGFYDVIGGSVVQPAVGAGVQVQAVGDDTTVHPSFSVGAVLNTGRFVVFGAYDVSRSTPEFGLTYNFRYGG